jgi:serine/threonine-protein kinase
MIFYFLLAGRLPWHAKTPTGLLEAHLRVDPAPLPEDVRLPAEVVELCMRCLAKEPDDRPSAAMLASLLDASLDLAPRGLPTRRRAADPQVTSLLTRLAMTTDHRKPARPTDSPPTGWQPVRPERYKLSSGHRHTNLRSRFPAPVGGPSRKSRRSRSNRPAEDGHLIGELPHNPQPTAGSRPGRSPTVTPDPTFACRSPAPWLVMALDEHAADRRLAGHRTGGWNGIDARATAAPSWPWAACPVNAASMGSQRCGSG